jgi:hypothetical protein
VEYPGIKVKNKTMDKAIKLSIEGGWTIEGIFIKVSDEVFFEPGYINLKRVIKGWKEGERIKITQELINKALLDPLFWQALGKAKGWSEKDFFLPDCEGCGMPQEQLNPWWRHVWHCFIDHLAEGKSAEEFFDNLLK